MVEADGAVHLVGDREIGTEIDDVGARAGVNDVVSRAGIDDVAVVGEGIDIVVPRRSHAVLPRNAEKVVAAGSVDRRHLRAPLSVLR